MVMTIFYNCVNLDSNFNLDLHYLTLRNNPTNKQPVSTSPPTATEVNKAKLNNYYVLVVE